MLHLSRFRWIAGAAALLLAVVVGWIWVEAGAARRLTDPAAARRDGQPIPVRTAHAQAGEVEEVVGATAVTIPSQIANVRIGPSRAMAVNNPVSEVIVKEVHVQEGSLVYQGKLLVSLEDEGLQEFHQQRVAAFAAAQAELDRIKEQTPLNKTVRALDLTAAGALIRFRTEDLENRRYYNESTSKLYRDKALTQLEYWDARSKYASAQHALTAAELNHQRAENTAKVGELSDQRDLARAHQAFEIARIDLDLARRDLERARVCSPLRGLVSRLSLVPGSIVGLNELVAEVIALDPIHLRVDLPQERLEAVAVGQSAEVSLDSFPHSAFRGKVIRILPRVNANLRVLPVIVELPNPDHHIKAGLSGYVRLRTKRPAVTVPALAVQQQGSQAVVFRVRDGRARACPVTIGPVLADGNQEVRGGLGAGDEVVIYQSNFYKNYGRVATKEAFLQDNDLVDTDWRKWARREQAHASDAR